MFQDRLRNLQEKMKTRGLTQMLVTDAPSIFYLIGRWIDAGERLLALLVKEQGAPILFINELFPEKEEEGLTFVWLKDVSDTMAVVEKLGRYDVVNASLLLDELRAIKSEEEKELMRKASKLNDEAMHILIESLEENMSELEVEERLKIIYSDLGADGFSFTPIIAFGKNGANPHHENGNRLLKKGDMVILDIGCRKNHYCADMTRTVCFGEVHEKAKDVFNIVLEANKRAIAMVKPGVRFKDIDLAARNYIEEQGYGPFFTHRTGHSIGIEVHDFGDVSSVNEDVLKPGMIFSVEPGIYLPGEFGVRIEDLILVTEDGYENLNQYPKEFVVV